MTFDKDDMATSVFWALKEAFDGEVAVDLGDNAVNFYDDSGKLIGKVDVWNYTEEDEDESTPSRKPSEEWQKKLDELLNTPYAGNAVEAPREQT